MNIEDQTTTINEDVQTIEYAPGLFSAIRKMDNISDAMIQKSLNPDSNRTQVFKAKESAGKSGSFFYYTSDSKYMLKTISHAEFVRLKTILKNYYDHMVKHPQTLITRFFGLHKIKYNRDVGGIQRIYFIIMANVFNTTRQINVRYDLKGSK